MSLPCNHSAPHRAILCFLGYLLSILTVCGGLGIILPPDVHSNGRERAPVIPLTSIAFLTLGTAAPAFLRSTLREFLGLYTTVVWCTWSAISIWKVAFLDLNVPWPLLCLSKAGGCLTFALLSLNLYVILLRTVLGVKEDDDPILSRLHFVVFAAPQSMLADRPPPYPKLDRLEDSVSEEWPFELLDVLTPYRDPVDVKMLSRFHRGPICSLPQH